MVIGALCSEVDHSCGADVVLERDVVLISHFILTRWSLEGLCEFNLKVESKPG
jgi:hypothetical protein